MVKKILYLIITIMLMLTYVGCSTTPEEKEIHDRMKCVQQIDYRYALGYSIYVDTETNVMYLARAKGGITVMLDADGKPLLWEEE